MSLEHLWAGWRTAYVTGATADNDAGCLFCALGATGDDKTDHIVHRADNTFVALNLYPYSSGHLMIAPMRHVGEFEELSLEEVTQVFTTTQQAVTALKTAYKPQGLNIGMNLGRVAGAGVPGHLHVHVVPRWNGDTNFMTSLANTRVLPEALEETAERIRAVWPN